MRNVCEKFRGGFTVCPWIFAGWVNVQITSKQIFLRRAIVTLFWKSVQSVSNK